MKTRAAPWRQVKAVVELVATIGLALALALAIQAFVVKPYKIPSGSMEPTLDIGQRVLVNRLGNDFSSPRVGDVIVFHPPRGANLDQASCGVAVAAGALCPRSIAQQSSATFIKRVVGVPGDRIAIVNGEVIRNGRRESAPYIRPCGDGVGCDFPDAITIPPGYYFVMGDNRGNSFDSRFWGPIPRSWIIGEAFATYWPPDRIGLL